MTDEHADGETEPVHHVSGPGLPIRGNDVDTDQIIPARFLKLLTFDGLGEFAFFDQRFGDDDEEKEHPFNEERFQDASVLVVNANFGCGSSREHAPQALMRWGIDAIVGGSFAEIFAGNCLALGLPTVTAEANAINELQDWVESNPDSEVAIDIPAETLTYDDQAIEVAVNETQREALVDGIWDTPALLGTNSAAVREKAGSLPYVELDE